MTPYILCGMSMKVFKAADNAYRSTRPSQAIAGVAAVSLDDTFHQGWRSDVAAEAELAALSGSRGRGGRGRFQRGQRGGRQNWTANSSGTGRGGTVSQSGTQTGGQGGRGGSQAHHRHKTPRHADKPPVQACFRHWTYGKSAHFCQEPSSCPWKEFWIPKSNNQ